MRGIQLLLHYGNTTSMTMFASCVTSRPTERGSEPCEWWWVATVHLWPLTGLSNSANYVKLASFLRLWIFSSGRCQSIPRISLPTFLHIYKNLQSDERSLSILRKCFHGHIRFASATQNIFQSMLLKVGGLQCCSERVLQSRLQTGQTPASPPSVSNSAPAKVQTESETQAVACGSHHTASRCPVTDY